MNNGTRIQYLEAMGIDVWVLKNPVQKAACLSNIDHFELDHQADESSKAEIDNWVSLEAEVAKCQACTLCNTRKQTVFGSGNQNADWMLIGEAPGQSEDLEGKPFVGQAGKLLTEMIRATGFERDDVYIANIIKCRPPNNRDPKVEEVSACRGYLQRQIELVKPKIILAVGRIAAQTLLQTNDSLAKLRGIPHQHSGIPLVVIYHPAYLLRSPLEKRKAWQDLLFAVNLEKNSSP